MRYFCKKTSMSENSNQIKDGSLVITERTIDVKEIIRSRNKRLAKLLPGFIINYLRKILHEKEVNKTIYDNREKHGLEMVDAIIDMFDANITVEGIENIENESRFLLAANHPLGGLDGIALMQAVGRVHPNIRFPVNDFLLYLPNLKELFIPISKSGKQSIQGVKEFEKTLASDVNVLYFPSGLASRKIKGEIMDLEWKKTFIQKAKSHHRNVIPTYVSGRNSNRFYRIAKIRKFFGIKANIEMLYLSDEMFRQKDKELKIIFGKPIPYTQFDKSKKDIEWAKYVKQIVYSLQQNM
ncbi:MAG: glycerol acyltransferase [Marinilabiliales bacterium]|nr:MAG: glycerol acyltransferase [Marinilabiliales bacterium]